MSPAARGQEAEGPLYDLLVIGGGINGAGIARDAAMRGLSVCLVDKNDWGWGTSAKSSMLAHGGLRYLEQFEFGLVHEALQERERLLRHAPHLVTPLRFLYPIYPHVAARRVVRVGLWLYDLLSHGKSLPKRHYQGRDDVLALAPGINGDDLQGGATYYDGQFQSVERFVAELVWDAKRHGAVCHNHARVMRLTVQAQPDGKGRRCTGAELEDAQGRRRMVRARCTINAAGTWVDDVLGELTEGRPAKVRKTKGVHVVVPRFVDVALIVKAATDGRTFFILPWKEHCIIGTTDTDYEGDAGVAAAEPQDVAYLLDEASRYFPDAPLTTIRYTYAGVRALVNQEGLTESNVTRRHILFDHGAKEGVAGLWTLQGGKITTYRSLAESAVDEIAKALSRQDIARRHPTRDAPLPGGPLVPWAAYREEAVATAMKEHLLPEASARHLVETYGARWRMLVDSTGPDGLRRIQKPHPHMWCEVDFAVMQEDARFLADVMLRRTSLGLAADGNMGVAVKVVRRMAAHFGWSDEVQEAQLQEYRRQSAVFGVPGSPNPQLASTDRSA